MEGHLKVTKLDHKTKLTIKNFDTNKPIKRLNELFPNIIRAIICGPSNCGKTNVLLNILSKIYYSDIIICSKTCYQEKYKFLEDMIIQFNKLCIKNDLESKDIKCLSIQSLPTPENVKPYSVIIFDDISTEQQDNIANYFAYGRHNNISCFYLCQTYSKIPKQLIRDNANYIILFKQDKTNLKHIFNDHCNDIDYDILKSMCIQCWKEQFSFLVIDKEQETNDGRYKKMFEFLFAV